MHQPQKRSITCDVLFASVVLLSYVVQSQASRKTEQNCLTVVQRYAAMVVTPTQVYMRASNVVHVWPTHDACCELHSTRNRSVTHWKRNTTDQMLQLIIRSAVNMKVKACTTLRFVRSWYTLWWRRGLSRGPTPLSCWQCWFESRRGHGCLCLVSVVCCQVEVHATGRALVQRNPTECMSLSVIEGNKREVRTKKRKKEIFITLANPEQTCASVMLLREFGRYRIRWDSCTGYLLP